MILLSDWGTALTMNEMGAEVNRAFSAETILGFSESWGVAPGWR